VSGLFPAGTAEQAGTWVAALVTLIVLAAAFGERRLFGVAQHLLAGLLTGLLVVLAIREVLLPRLIEPVVADPTRLDLWLAMVLVAILVAAPLVPPRIAALPVGILVAGTAALALAGAVTGTLIPQIAAGVISLDGTPAGALGGAIALVLAALVLVAFLHGAPRTRIGAQIAVTGRWLLLAGLGGFLGFLAMSRLALLVDRLTFLVGDWLGLVR